MSKKKLPRFTHDTAFETTNLDEQPMTLPDGTILNETGAEKYAANVLARRRAANLVPGGKSLTGEGTHSPVVQFRVPEPLRNEVQERAASEGITVSRLARKALERYLAS